MYRICVLFVILSLAHSFMQFSGKQNINVKSTKRYQVPFAQQMAALSSAKDIILSDSGAGLSKTELNEYILKLEKLNPTEDPALSPLLNGVWEVVSSGVSSPGMVGIQAIKGIPGRLLRVEDLTITISSEYPRVTAATELKGLVGPPVSVSVVTDLEVESGVRLKESYVSGKLGPVSIPLSTIKTFSRNILISYLDQDLLIARNKYGSPEVLKRREYFDMQETGTPAASDDFGSPSA